MATISNKVDVRARKLNKRQREAIHNDKRINPPKRRKHPKYEHTKQQGLKIHEAKTAGAERRNSQDHNNTWGLQHPLSARHRIIRGKISRDIGDLNSTIN